jgi:hypothetical protein
MGTRSQGVSGLWGLLLVMAMVAHVSADPKGDVGKEAKNAMESYDLMDYDAAKKSLNVVVEKAKKAKLEKDPVYAKIHVYLGITAFASGDADGAKAAFAIAVGIDPKIQIDAAYKSPELVKLLDTARSAAASGGGGAIEPANDGTDCASVKGMQHNIIDSGRAGGAQPIEALIGSEVTPVKVAVMYRIEKTTDFVEAKLTKSGGCKYQGAIPATAMRGTLIHYYVAAYDANNKVIVSKGSSGSPNIMELTAGGGGGGGGGSGDTEDPIGGSKIKKGGGGGGAVSGGEVSGGVLKGGKAPRVFIAVAGGTGFGYVTGKTEADNEVQNCCIGNSLVVITPEIGYYASRQLSIGIAGRIGLPIGANVDPPDAKHSTIAPGAVVRIRYALSASGEGVRVMGQIGGGVMRNTIKLEMQPGGGDTDIVAQGPLLIGAGIGFKKSLSGNLAFVADLSALAGIAVVDKLGTAKLNTGIGGDVTLGLAVGF